MADMSDGFHVRAAEILLVEDNPGDARLTLEALADSKIRNTVHHVEDGATALALVRREGEYAHAPRPDLILLDLNLPGLDGRDVLAAIKSDPALRSIPVVVLTTSQAETDICRSYELQANSYVVKPIDFEQFAKVVYAIEDFWFQIVRLPSRAA